MDQTSSLSLHGRLWNRLRELSGNDDKPGIEDFIGRAELTGSWQINQANTLVLSVGLSLVDW